MFGQAGRTLLFTDNHVQRIVEALPCPSRSPRRATPKRRTSDIRGTYLGVPVDKSSGTPKRSVAQSILKRIEGEIERGEHQRTEIKPDRPAATFMSAAVAYLETGHRKRYVGKLMKHFGEMPLADIDQATIDEAALTLHPNAGPGTRNAAVYTPASAILHHAGVDIEVKRPKGGKGRVVTEWLSQEDAFAIMRRPIRLAPDFPFPSASVHGDQTRRSLGASVG